jgi:SAM-dependent methyltransferase
MADVEHNVEVWASWDWSRGGDEWSDAWGGTDALWRWTLFPRIQDWIPAPTILEIAPGFGRWTQYLKQRCDRLIAVDLSEVCIDACRRRFAGDGHVELHVNDGRSLEMVDDDSIDFAFSFDSLVHVESDVIEAYLGQLATKLKRDAVAFIHHSNAGAYRRHADLTRRLPLKVREPFMSRGLLMNINAWRGESVTAEGFAEASRAAGLSCISQEKISWIDGKMMIDTISVVTPRGSRFERPLQVVENPGFSAEAARVKAVAPLYGSAEPRS